MADIRVNKMTADQKALFHLVGLGIYDDAWPLEITYRFSWESVLKLSRSQNVTALALDGAHKILTYGQDVSNGLDGSENKALRFKWMSLTVSLETEYLKRKNLISKLQTCRIPFIVLKGLSFSNYYPVPEHREGGDIDLFASGDGCERINEFVESKGVVVDRRIRLHSQFKLNGILIENHRLLCPESKPLNDYLSGLLDGAEGCCPSDEFNAILCLQHARKHFLTEGGINLKSIADWSLIRRSIDDIEGFINVVKRYGLERFYRPLNQIADLLDGIIKEDDLSENAREMLDDMFGEKQNAKTSLSDSYIGGKLSLIKEIVTNRRKFKKYNDCSMPVFFAKALWRHFS